MSSVIVVSDISAGMFYTAGTEGNAYCIKIKSTQAEHTFCGRFKVPEWEGSTPHLEAAAIALGIELAKQLYPGRRIKAYTDAEAVVTHKSRATKFPYLSKQLGGLASIELVHGKEPLVRRLHQACHNNAKARYKAKHYIPMTMDGKVSAGHIQFMEEFGHLIPKNSAIWQK